ncbi:aminoacyl-tRNA hydrolase [Candidatus Clostridium stratigraminis]|uniref:Peptidyl-tRNA hydrolase n=1 Tax=Candidatus Clostridium stratigraminis TaxID=3381661 RepID=A0ABW8T6A5_9CLOT
MYLIVGLGNPGIEYSHTRHNVGFDVIDLLAEKYNIKINRIKFKGSIGEGSISGEKVILLKPSTFMNLSGESVIEASNFYKIPKENIIVLYDDISLEVGRLRVRPDGSAGGHNGIKNIIQHLSSEIFPRVKVGVGQPKGDLVRHVLGSFSKEEREVLSKVFQNAALAAVTIISDGITEAMNKYNGIDTTNSI